MTAKKSSIILVCPSNESTFKIRSKASNEMSNKRFFIQYFNFWIEALEKGQQELLYSTCMYMWNKLAKMISYSTPIVSIYKIFVSWDISTLLINAWEINLSACSSLVNYVC